MIMKQQNLYTKNYLNYINIDMINYTCPTLPGYFKIMPPLEQAAAIFPLSSTHIAPTVSILFLAHCNIIIK